MKSFVALPLAFLALSFFSFAEAGEPLARIEIPAVGYDRAQTPMCADLPESIAADSAVALVALDSEAKKPIPAQIEPGAPPRLHWILDALPAGRSRAYAVETAGSSHEPAILASRNDKGVLLRRGEASVMQYNSAVMPAPEGASPLFARSGFIHPLWAPSGAVVTNIQPADHLHHMGIWMPWTQTKFEGRPVDFWNLNKGQGTVRFAEMLGETSGPVYGGFRVRQEHVAFGPDEGRETVVLDEIWDVKVYNVGGPQEGFWLWDFVSTQRVVADSPLLLEEYRYGGLGYRAPESWDKENAGYLTSEGLERDKAHTSRGRWCDMRGRESAEAPWRGVTIMSHPENHEHPEPMRVWPEGKVFFNFAPVQAGDWQLEPGREYTFRYRFYVHEGLLDVSAAERYWRDFAGQ